MQVVARQADDVGARFRRDPSTVRRDDEVERLVQGFDERMPLTRRFFGQAVDTEPADRSAPKRDTARPSSP